MELSDNKYLSMFFKAFGNPIRLRILKELTESEKCVGEMETSIGTSQATVSQHLAILKEYGVVECRKDGNVRCYYLRHPESINNILNLAENIQKEEKS